MSSADVTAATSRVAAAVEGEGLLLVHDRVLPSMTRLIAGEPVAGSWWAHPLANLMYTVLGELEERFAICKVVASKLTLVAPDLWPHLAAIGESHSHWQMAGLSLAEHHLLTRTEASTTPILLDTPQLREAGRALEERLLAPAAEVHTDSGRHLKALMSWRSWRRERGVEGELPAPETAMARLEAIADGWGAGRSALPWRRATA